MLCNYIIYYLYFKGIIPHSYYLYLLLEQIPIFISNSVSHQKTGFSFVKLIMRINKSEFTNYYINKQYYIIYELNFSIK